jgi:membrane-associated phospholipid phosphatase
MMFLMKQALHISFILLCAALSIIFVDQRLSLWFAEPAQQALKEIARMFTDLGLGAPWFALSILIFLFSRKNLSLKNWSMNFFIALLFSGFILHVCKFLFGRQRPHKSSLSDQLVFAPFNFDSHFQSMPSGHAQVVFCVATCFALLTPKWRSVFYIFAAALAFTRVMTHQHFLSDILVGACIGHFATLWSFSVVSKKWRFS